MKLPLLIVSLSFPFFTGVSAETLTSAEQADSFHAKGVSAEARGEDHAAMDCFTLALRIQPSHPGALAGMEKISKKRMAEALALSEKRTAETLVRAAAFEKNGELKAANLEYAMVLGNSPNHPVAKAKLAELKGKLGAGFIDPAVTNVYLWKKLKDIVIPRIDFEDVTVEEAIDFFRLRAAELDMSEPDPAKKGVNLVIRRLRNGSDPGVARIKELRLRNVPLQTALKYICDQTKTRFMVDQFAVTITSSQDASPSTTPPSATPSPAVAANPGVASIGSAVPQWKSRDGKSVPGKFVGLDGEAVVISRDGKEFTIPFSRLDPASVKQAKALGEISGDVLLHFDFSDGSGTTAKDRSGNGRDGTLVGFTDTNAGAGNRSSSGWASSGALRFDGADDYITTPLTVADLGSGSFTIEAVVSHGNAQDDWSPVVSTDATDYRAPGGVHLGKVTIGFDISPPSALVSRHNGLSEEVIYSRRPTSLFDGALHHVALVWNAEAQEVSLHFDHLMMERLQGVQGRLGAPFSADPFAQVSPTAAAANATTKLLVGAVGWSNSERWTGTMSEVRITRRALAPAQFLPNPNPRTAKSPLPKHRWSFSGDLLDSIGGAQGTLVDPGAPTAVFANGKLDLSKNRGEGSRAPVDDAYVDLPNSLVSGTMGKVTFEVWCEQHRWDGYASVFRFEKGTAPEGQTDSVKSEGYGAILLVPRNQANHVFAGVIVGSLESFADAKFDINSPTQRHFAVVLDPANPSAGAGGTTTLFIDGYPAASGALPPGFLDSFVDNNGWLGRTWGQGKLFAGAYNEFRIYDKALTADEVLASFLAGPDASMPTVGAKEAGGK